MANQTILREMSENVVGIGGFLIIIVVATEAITRQSGHLIVHMAFGAENRAVRTVQRKSTGGNMIECSALPTRFVVAFSAFGWETERNVIGQLCCLEIRFVTGETFAWRSGKLFGVTCRAFGGFVGAAQFKNRVIKSHILIPGDCRGLVAIFAVQRKSSLLVIWIDRFVKFRDVAGKTGACGTGKFVALFADVAALAIRNCMSTG